MGTAWGKGQGQLLGSQCNMEKGDQRHTLRTEPPDIIEDLWGDDTPSSHSALSHMHVSRKNLKSV